MCYHFTTPLCGREKERSVERGAIAQAAVADRPRTFRLGWVKGLEPSTPGTTIRCSNQLSYTHHMTAADTNGGEGACG